MARKKISQAEARSLKRQVATLKEERRNGLCSTGTFIWRLPGMETSTKFVLQNTARLGFSLRARLDDGTLELYAVK